MVPLFVSSGNRLQLIVICDSKAHLDDQSLLPNTFIIFDDLGKRDSRVSKGATLQFELIKDAEYYGFLTRSKSEINLYSYN